MYPKLVKEFLGRGGGQRPGWLKEGAIRDIPITK